MNKLIKLSALTAIFFSHLIVCSEKQLSCIEAIPAEIIVHSVIPHLSLKSLNNLSRTSKEMCKRYNPTALLNSKNSSDQQVIAGYFKSFHKTSRALMNFHETKPEIAQFVWDHQPENKKEQRNDVIQQLYNQECNTLQDLNHITPIEPYLYRITSISQKNKNYSCKRNKYIQSIITASIITHLKNNNEKPCFIFDACEQGDYHLVKYLLKNSNAAITTCSEGHNTLLHSTCYDLCNNDYMPNQKSYLKIIELLIKKGIDVNAQNLAGETALHIMADIKSDKLEIAEAMDLLINNGADHNIFDNSLRLPYHRAIKTQNDTFIKTFDKHGKANKISYRCHIAKTVATCLTCIAIPTVLTYLKLTEEYHSEPYNQTTY